MVDSNNFLSYPTVRKYKNYWYKNYVVQGRIKRMRNNHYIALKELTIVINKVCSKFFGKE